MLLWILVVTSCMPVDGFSLINKDVNKNEPSVYEPTWHKVSELRQLGSWNKGNILRDIECRMPSNHGYEFPSMPMTWAHETTHGLNSNIRNKLAEPNKKINALYCLEGKCAIINEPKCKLSSVANAIPKSIRGPSYHLYLIQQQQYWNDTPTYLLDEWVAYTNGSECGREVNENGWHYELLQAINFSMYSIVMAQQVSVHDKNYDHQQLKAFIYWNTMRCMDIYKTLRDNKTNSTHIKSLETFINNLKNSSDTIELRGFGEEYFGKEQFEELYR